MKITGKHRVEEINGTRCSVVEKEAIMERANFLESILVYNGYKVLIQRNVQMPSKTKITNELETVVNTVIPDTFKIGVTDKSFNVAVMVYSRKLKTLENKIILPAYWNQEDVNYDGWYWKYKNKLNNN